MKKFIALIMVFLNISIFGNWLIMEDTDIYEQPNGNCFAKNYNYKKHSHLEYRYHKILGQMYIIELNDTTSKELKIREADKVSYTNVQIVIDGFEFTQEVLYDKKKKYIYITKAQLGYDFDLLHMEILTAKDAEIKVFLSNGVELDYPNKYALSILPLVDYRSKIKM